MDNHAQSQVIVVVLLILLVLAAILIFWQVFTKAATPDQERLDKTMTCLEEVDLKVTEACYKASASPNRWDLEITIKNTGQIDYEDHFDLKVADENGIDNKNIDNFDGLDRLESKLYAINNILKYPPDSTFSIVPKYELDGKIIYCTEKTVEFSPTLC